MEVKRIEIPVQRGSKHGSKEKRGKTKRSQKRKERGDKRRRREGTSRGGYFAAWEVGKVEKTNREILEVRNALTVGRRGEKATESEMGGRRAVRYCQKRRRQRGKKRKNQDPYSERSLLKRPKLWRHERRTALKTTQVLFSGVSSARGGKKKLRRGERHEPPFGRPSNG